ncbi:MULTISPECIES: protein adenylyltransferase SelO [Kocuria]|uniref:Protein nucleotidyltransferase YdiU n=1 Tax=Kocuria subflava TaxID=1736139 RepID=A0A846TY67_9MICC|nr:MULTISPECIES: YdiU family protein [Kocuria]NKE10564.1 YdiU family protein [Kocuria subflava]
MTSPAPTHATSSALAASTRLEHTYATQVPQLSVRWSADPATAASWVVVNDSLAQQLGIDPAFLRSPEGVDFLHGQFPAEPHSNDDDAPPTYAQAYAGHQFGQFVPQLGDGRALLLGEVVDVDGNRRDLHLKGSGRTPFSRGGDGKAPLGPMLREYLIGEAMHALGIPSTRALAVVETGQQVQRQQPGPQPGAVLTRVAASHLRVGTFQFAAVHRSVEVKRALADHAIARHWPEAADAENPYLELLRCVTHAQAPLIARWMLVGFIHGVMNTDNMTISGESIDYGPCAFVDRFSRGAVFSSIDRGGRYAYRNQPAIGLWNLSRFAETLIDLIDDDPNVAVECATAVLHEYEPAYDAALARGFAAKLGVDLGSAPDPEALTQFRAFVETTFDLMEVTGQDFTLFFRAVAEDRLDERVEPEALTDWMAEGDRLVREWAPGGIADGELARRSNPVYIPRNHHLDRALNKAEQGDMSDFHRLLAAVQDPYGRRDEFAGLEGPGSESAFVTFCGT